MIRLLLSMTCLVVASLANVALADEAEQYKIIRDLLQSGKVSDAEEAFKEAIQEFPDSPRLKTLHYMLYFYNNRDENYPAAIEHLEAYITSNLLPTEQRPEGSLSSLAVYVDRLLTAYQDAGKPQQGREKLDELLTQVESLAKSHQENVYAHISLRELRNTKLQFLAKTGQQDQARTILATRLAEAEQTLKDQPDDALAQLDLVFLLKGDSQLAEEAHNEDADAKQQLFLDRLMTVASEHQDNVPLIVTALGEHLSAVGGMARKQPYEAETMLKKLKEFCESIENEDPAVKSKVSTIERSTAALERSIESGKFHADLIGTDAIPLVAEAWVHGEPLSDADLQGKVVLLDFWAVWCGPCIATFPHLREWQEKYEDKGLVIVGVTRYYNYGWDEEASRPKKAEDELAPEDEQAAMLKFAAHHELQHRFMVTPKESTFQKDYGVSGIPQAVLIDREGKIRLIRVGSGDANAEEIDKLLVELIGDGS